MSVSRVLLLAGVAVVASAGAARAQASGVAVPSLSPDIQAPIGQGQSAFPSPVAPANAAETSTMADSPPTTQSSPAVDTHANAITAQGGLPKPTNTDSAPAAPTNTALVMAPAPLVRPNTNPVPMVVPTSSSSGGIDIPSPPPPSAFSNDPNQLAAQAEIAAQDAQAQAEAQQMERERQHNVKSFDKASTGLLPLQPEQIRDFMRRLEQTQSAAQFPAEGPPKGQTRIATLSLDPGVDPPQVNLATGYVTTITMVDATGEPWPILDVGVGGNFEVSPTQAGTHVVRVMPLTRVGVGDLSVLLKDCPTPVIFRLSAGGPTVDLRYDARIGKLGPGAKPQIIARPRLEAGDETLTLILENAPPGSAKRLKVGGLDARTKAWSLGDKVYVRTPLTLLSPAWNASVASADGMTVYEIGNAPVLLMSDNGAMVRAQILQGDDK